MPADEYGGASHDCEEDLSKSCSVLAFLHGACYLGCNRDRTSREK